MSVEILSGGLVQITATGDAGHEYELQKSASLEAWEKLIEFPFVDTPYRYIDPASVTGSLGFYRLGLVR